VKQTSHRGKVRKDAQIEHKHAKLNYFFSSGTTWTQEMVWCIANDLDFEAAKKTTLDERVPFFE
jgi:hypothetical protein